MKITYLHHSGFSVETETKVLLFDYYTEGGRKAYFDPAAYPDKAVFVFVSHAHEDHYDRRILSWAKLPNVRYVLSFDVRTEAGFEGRVLRAEPHRTYDFDGISIQTLRSNDEGVAFLVKADGKTIYHAGDLNWWHWAGEGDSDNLAARDEYFKELERIPRVSMNIVFFPVDARQAVAREWGVKAFLEKFDVSTALVPMHAFGIRWSPSYEFRWRFPDIPLWIPKAEGDVYVGEVK